MRCDLHDRRAGDGVLPTGVADEVGSEAERSLVVEGVRECRDALTTATGAPMGVVPDLNWIIPFAVPGATVALSCNAFPT